MALANALYMLCPCWWGRKKENDFIQMNNNNNIYNNNNSTKNYEEYYNNNKIKNAKTQQETKKEIFNEYTTNTPIVPLVMGRPYLSGDGSFNLPRITFNSSSGEQNWNTVPIVSQKKNNSLTDTERDKKIHKWTEIAQSEHASVASFALFSQKLLSIGAPPFLISESLQCAIEEISHAQFSFSLASSFLSSPISPSYYPPHTLTINPDLFCIVKETIEEGCVQETVSALDACRDITNEEDEEVKIVLQKIIEDEAHHAAFAWKVVRWAIEKEKDNTPDERILNLLDDIISPESLEKIGGGKYLEEDKKLILAVKETLMCNYRTTDDKDNIISSIVKNRVSERILEVVQ